MADRQESFIGGSGSRCCFPANHRVVCNAAQTVQSVSDTSKLAMTLKIVQLKKDGRRFLVNDV